MSHDFTQWVLDQAKPSESFEPVAFYDADGDCITFHAKPDPYYGVRADNLVTVFRSQESEEIIGCCIKGVRGFLKRCPRVSVALKNGKLRLEYLFFARLMECTTNQGVLETLFVLAQEQKVEAEMEPCPA